MGKYLISPSSAGTGQDEESNRFQKHRGISVEEYEMRYDRTALLYVT